MQSNHVTASEHYLGERGKEYFSLQSVGGSQRGRINARKFFHWVRSSDTVLDFGCGSGALLCNLNCKRRIGIEINPAARAVAQKSGVEVHETVDTIPSQVADVILSNHALEHTFCPLNILQELYEKLLRGGLLVLCLPMDDWRTQKRYISQDINHHLYTWTPLLLGNLLFEAGYKIEKIWVYTHAWPPSNWQKLDDMLPTWLFDLICTLTALRYKRRQVMALASKP